MNNYRSEVGLRQWGKNVLRPQEHNLWCMLVDAEECEIRDLFIKARPDANASAFTPRRQQQIVGAITANINRLLVASDSDYRIRTGEARSTYRLCCDR